MMRYRVVAIINEELARIQSPRYGLQLWSRGRKRGRPAECVATGADIAPGDVCWHPITNRSNRGHRLSQAFVCAGPSVPESPD